MWYRAWLLRCKVTSEPGSRGTPESSVPRGPGWNGASAHAGRKISDSVHGTQHATNHHPKSAWPSEPSNQSHLHARAHAGSAQPGSGAQPGPASHWQPITPLSIRGFWDSALLITCSGWIWIGLSESDGSPFGGSYRAVRVGVWHPKRTDLVPISSATRKVGTRRSTGRTLLV